MSINIYPVTKTKDHIENYKVKVNGQPVTLDTARVSAVPFNRRWPGHQRQKEQTELVNFLSLSSDESVSFEIIPQNPFEEIIIRPLSLGITPKIKDGKITFTLEKPAYFTVEPYGRNNALHIFCDPTLCYDVDYNDTDVIYFGKGEHDVGEIILKSNQTLFIDEGAVVYACIKSIDSENIRILGRGILDNSKNTEKILFEYNAENNISAVNNAKREHTIQLEYCNNIKIEGITIRDSLVYNIRPIGCKNMHISNVKIIGCWRYNSDGIDMHNCEDVMIDNCFLRTFDDSICVKGFDCYYDGDVEKAVKEAMYRKGKAYDIFKNTVVKNCTIWNDWGKCLEIGAETRAEEIYNIVFENCDIIHVTGPVLDCCNVDYADVHDVVYRNINIEYDEVILKGIIQNKDCERYQNNDLDYTPNLICVISAFHHEYSAGGTRRGINRNMLFSNIHLYGRQMPKLYFEGYDDTHQTKDIVIENLHWNGQLLKKFNEDQFVTGEFTQNICYKTSEYQQLQKNTVCADRQLNNGGHIRFFNLHGKGKRVMFVGNSITLHGIKKDIGWNGEWGMAASAEDKDYVHRLMTAILKKSDDAAFCICQVAEWEREYKNGSTKHDLYENARNFDADIIVMRFIENCPQNEFNCEIFKRELGELLDYLNKSSKAKVILTTGFWKHPGDKIILEYAKENNLPCVKLGDLGELDEMKAIGLFSHNGVANHPGDLGMKNIAERILTELEKLI